MNITFGTSDYGRGFRDGQEARRRDDARRDYERGHRDGYGTPAWPQVIPVYPIPYYPITPFAPTWGDSGTYRLEFPSLPATCTFN